MSFDVRFGAAADDDLAQLFDYLLDRAKTLEDLDMAQAAIEAVRSAALSLWPQRPTAFARRVRARHGGN